MTHVSRVVALAWNVLAAVIGGAAMIAMIPAWHAFEYWYDQSDPVWVAVSSTIISHTNDELTVSITGDKRRDCALRRTWGQVYYTSSNGPIPSTDAAVSREGAPVFGTLRRPLGLQDLGSLNVSPVPKSANHVDLHVEHDCDGRTVRSKLASVKLENKP